MAVSDTLPAFSLKVSRWFRDQPPEAVRVQMQKVGGEGLKGVVLKTPVKEGRARGAWMLGIGTVPQGEPGTLDKGGGPTIERGLSELAGYRGFEVVSIVNNVPYIVPLENGHSSRNPDGMVAVTVEELKAMFG